MTVLRWLWRHIYIILFATGAAALWALRVAAGPRQKVRDELTAIDAAEKRRLDAIQKDKDIANAAANREYKATLAALDKRQRQKADRLLADPVRRVRFLRRMSKRLERGG